MQEKPGVDLDRLAKQHRDEEAQEAARTLLENPRPMALRFPQGGHFPESDQWLERLYAGERMAREKKPGVYDHLRSWGPWFVSVDKDPMSVLDGMSQTATVCGGFAEDEVVEAYLAGRFGQSGVKAEDTSLAGSQAAEAFAQKLRELRPGLDHVSFANGGAEANEKAFALCRANHKNPKAHRVLAFEGSFHGRTLLSLHATWNPVKRGPFEFKGYEAVFAPFPLWTNPAEGEPEAPEALLKAAGEGDMASLEALRGSDDLLNAEIDSLKAVDAALSGGECFVCIVEPMQSEGGDRYASARFFKALRLLTRHHQTSLIFDEVQTGFGLGGLFFWHDHFGLVDRDGNPDLPDAVTLAKRAQVGAVISRFEDPEPTSAHSASLWRGLVHAEMMSSGDAAARTEAITVPLLQGLAADYPDLVASPRARGFALAFDMPTPEVRNNLIGQRFWRGAIVFGAGARTIRYRLSNVFDEAEIRTIFEGIRASLDWLVANPGQKPPAWQDAQPPARPDAPQVFATRIRRPGPGEADAAIREIMALEARIFEPARRDPEYKFRWSFEEGGSVVLAEVQREENGPWVLAGYSTGAPLEKFVDLDGPKTDMFLNQGNTLYSTAISVDPEFQGLGLGKRVKAEQIRDALSITNQDGSPRYAYITGRNRVGFTQTMERINRSFGAQVIEVFDNQYNDPDGKALYYRIPIRGLVPPAASSKSEVVDCAGTLSAPFAEPPASLRALEENGLLAGPTVTKITICNYISPAIVRAIEWVGALVPEMPHLYLTSGRDETVDKAVRTLRYYRKEGSVVIGVKGGYVGHTSVTARSVSDPETHLQGDAYFDWPLVAHPSEDVEATIQALRDEIEKAGGADRVLGLFIEPIQERTGEAVPAKFWKPLEELRQETGLPVVFVETASSYYRTGLGAFASDSIAFQPDIMIWWSGGQQGFVHMTDRFFISKPLTMVSTWDGDELSLVRVHHQLQEARNVDISAASAVLDEAASLMEAGKMRGAGLYRVLDLGEKQKTLLNALLARNVEARAFPQGRVGFLPPLDRALEASEALRDALKETL